MRLIDADALTQDLAKGFAGGCGGEATLEQCVNDDTLADAIKTVEEQPTVDAMPVIRCKDCKHRSYGTVEGKHLCMLDRYRFFPTTDEDYCSHAEREDE